MTYKEIIILALIAVLAVWCYYDTWKKHNKRGK